MAQLERPQRHDDSSKTSTIQTMEQLLRAGEGSKLSPKKLSPKMSRLSPTFSTSSLSPSSPSSPFFQRLKHHDPEEDHGQNQKKSVLTKVKEKAKKLRHSLSKKKQEEGNVTPSKGAGLEDDGNEEDAEYLGAPMYESEMAPEGYKENARQHPRASPVINEKKNVLPSNNEKPQVEHDREKSLSRSMSKRTTQPETATATTAAATTLPGSNNTMTKTAVVDKLTPPSAEGSHAVHSITSKIQGLAVSKPEEHHTSSPTGANSLSFAAPRTPPAKTPSQTTASASRTSSAPVTPLTSAPVTAPTSPSSAPARGKNTSPTAQLWDKGVSMKEYLMNKLEPGEDEKALSQVISEAMSPRRTPGDAGVMEKVREAVTSLLRNEGPKKYADATTTTTTTTNATNATTAHSSSQTPVSYNTTRASSQIPVSTNAQEVVQEENHGRILQAN